MLPQLILRKNNQCLNPARKPRVIIVGDPFASPGLGVDGSRRFSCRINWKQRPGYGGKHLIDRCIDIFVNGKAKAEKIH